MEFECIERSIAILSLNYVVYTEPIIIELQRGTSLCLNSALLYATLKLSMHSLNSASIIIVYKITSIKCYKHNLYKKHSHYLAIPFASLQTYS